MAIQWSKKLSVGSDLIDDQHKELFRRFNDLVEACRQQKGKQKVIELLNFLDQYVISHFSDEEKLMERCGYPGRLAHGEQHRDFIGKLAELRGAMKEEGASLRIVVETNQILLEWIIHHIRTEDGAVGVHLSRQVKKSPLPY